MLCRKTEAKNISVFTPISISRAQFCVNLGHEFLSTSQGQMKIAKCVAGIFNIREMRLLWFSENHTGCINKYDLVLN